MNEYEVKIPIAGFLSVTVEAQTELEAQQLAYENAEWSHVAEWDTYKKLVKGSVICAPLWQIEVINNGEVLK